MANVKKESTSNGGGMVSGLIIVACIGVGVLIWKFIMGNPSNFEGGNNEGHPLNTLGQVYHGGCSAGIVRNVINGSCFSIERFLISKAAGKDKLDAFMTKSLSIKTGEIDEAIVLCDKQQGSVAIQSNLL
jgi:biopolymer transport protein ExbB